MSNARETFIEIPRETFIEIVKEDFKDTSIKNKCIEASREKILKGQADRAFDSFPHLTPNSELKILFNEFTKTLSRIRPNKHYTLNDNEKLNISALERSIVRKACFELLDSDGQLKDELLQLLGWDDLKNKLDASVLVYAFVSAIHQQLTENLFKSGSIKKYGEAYKTLYHFVNPNFTKWIIEEMKSANYKYDNSYYEQVERSNFDKILSLPVERPVETMGVIAGVAAAVAVGITLFTTLVANNSKQEKPDPSHPFNGPKM